MTKNTNAFHRLYRECEAKSTRPYRARGISLKRCKTCQLGEATCICPWRVAVKSDVKIILIMHRDEIFKPTNSGRLIADVLPESTYAFEWSRKTPSPELLKLLEDPLLYPVIVFPTDESHTGVRHTTCPTLSEDQNLALIILDGTWKQAQKMFRSSEWLKHLPVISLDLNTVGEYSVRKALHEGQLSTAEATAAVLEQCGKPQAAQVLSDYFTVFNHHYACTRMPRPPVIGESHERLTALLLGELISRE